jgi:NADPH:quinone reductase-like Zn-dependent oxidoreductase
MRALLLNAERKTANAQTRPLPIPADDELLIEVHAIALNPVDALYTSNPLGATGRIVGSDFVGKVISAPPNSALHSSAMRSFRPGDQWQVSSRAQQVLTIGLERLRSTWSVPWTWSGASWRL